MGDTVPDFCNLFYNIKGDLLSERKKNFQKLLKNPCFKHDSAQLHQALTDLKPRNYLEGLFKVDALIHFKRTNELQDILIGGNEVYISKLLKQFWYIKEVFGNMPCETFVNKFLPTMSYTFKLKFIKKMSMIWNEAKNDELFDCIYDRYGLPLAKTLIHKCSAGKIINIFEQYEIKLTANQEKHLFDRDQNLFLGYILQHNRAFHKYDERKVIDYIALKNSEFLLELKQKDAFVLHKLGRKTTKKVFKIVKEDILDNVDVHKDILKHSVMVRMLGKEFDIVFDKKFPNNFHDKSIYTLKSSIAFQLLPLCSKRKRWHLFYKTYTNKFPEKGLSEVLSVFDDDYIMKLHADKSIIQKWAQTKYKESCSEEYLKYYTNVPEAVSVIKEKINVTSDKSNRIRLVKLLIEACDINNDLTTLEKVLAYVVKRHRNEEPSKILRAISRINMEKLNSAHWQHIRSLVKVVKVIDYYSSRIFTQYYIEYLIKNNQTTEDAVKEYLEEYDQGQLIIELHFEDPSIHSKFIHEALRIFPRVAKNKDLTDLFHYAVRFSIYNQRYALDLRVYRPLVEFLGRAMESEEIDYKISQLVRSLLLYNLSCSEYEIPIKHDYMLRFIEVQIETSYIYMPYLFERILLKKERTPFENRLFEIYWANVDKYYASDITDWFLSHDPISILPHFDKISTMSANGAYRRMISDKAMILIKYSHFGFDKKLSEKYEDKVLSLLNLDPEAIKSADTIRRLVKQLPKLLSTDDFLKLVLKCTPEKEKIDVDDPKMKVVYSLQSEVISVLHKVAEPAKMLSVLMRFCAGDYLRHALQPLYSIMCRSSEEEICPCIEVLAKRAMSVRKHALSLTTLVLDRKTAINTLKNTKSEDISENKSIFLKMLKYFQKNPSNELFQLCMENLKVIDKNDTETLDLLTNIEVPWQYKVELLERCWTFFEDLGANDVRVEKYLNTLMLTILADNRIVAALSSGFVQKNIRDYFTTDNVENVKLFTLTVLFCRISERQTNFKAVFDMLKDFTYKKVHCFANNLFEFLRHDKEAMSDDVFLDMFYEYWCTYFPLEHSLQDHISLKVLSCYRKSQSKELFAHNVVDYFEKLLEKYGCLLLDIFKGGLDRLLNILDTPEKYTFYLNAMKYKPRRAELYVLVITSVRNVVNPKSEEVLLHVYNDLIKILETVDDSICKIHYQYDLVKNS